MLALQRALSCVDRNGIDCDEAPGNVQSNFKCRLLRIVAGVANGGVSFDYSHAHVSRPGKHWEASYAEDRSEVIAPMQMRESSS